MQLKLTQFLVQRAKIIYSLTFKSLEQESKHQLVIIMILSLIYKQHI